MDSSSARRRWRACGARLMLARELSLGDGRSVIMHLPMPILEPPTNGFQMIVPADRLRLAPQGSAEAH